MKRLKTIEMEIALFGLFNYRQNIIVTNVSWGIKYFPFREIDFLILSKDRYATEVEIKVSMADLKIDANKKHGHKSPAIRRTFFAIPEYLAPDAYDYIPNFAGIILVDGDYKCRIVRQPRINRNAIQWDEATAFKLAKLGTMRIPGYKKRINNLRLSLEGLTKKAN